MSSVNIIRAHGLETKEILTEPGYDRHDIHVFKERNMEKNKIIITRKGMSVCPCALFVHIYRLGYICMIIQGTNQVIFYVIVLVFLFSLVSLLCSCVNNFSR